MRTELCELAEKWTTDKAIFYTPFYHELFKDRRSIKKVLEIGIGYSELMLSSVARMGLTEYKTGASLFMWQEYFPEAQIFALDNKTETFINEGRIRSFYCDQGSKKSFEEVIEKIGADFDLIIEDGSHIREHQILSAQMMIPLLKDGGIYIMEDVREPFDELTAQLPYTSEVKTFYRPDLDQEAAVIVINR